ncbi:MAG TPA: HEAT repeat domain-containing protein [Thermoanaerobaculia bacterium]|nr:HEAT repeat domain-containing protein [Thermoanaerobaculia bacterium]
MKLRLVLISLLVLATTGIAQTPDAISRMDGWVSWTVPLAEGVRICCNGCSVSSQGFTTNINDDGPPERFDMLVAVKIAGGRIVNARGFQSECRGTIKGATVRHLTGVSVDASLDFLAAHLHDRSDASKMLALIAQHDSPRIPGLLLRFARRGEEEDVRKDAVFWLGQRGGEEGYRYLRDLVRNSGESQSLRERAVFSMSQSKAGDTQELIDIARNHENRRIRREAIFWLGQKAGEKAASELRRAVDDDPDEDVREHAVFAISQLPKERGVPILIDLARNHKSPAVRKKAIFWLVQSGDDRALGLVEEILR